jgi:ABC-type transport system substrate-binding protein
LHAQHDIRLVEGMLGDQGASRLVRRIGQQSGDAGTGLHGHLVTGRTKPAYQLRNHCHTRLAGSLLPGQCRYVVMTDETGAIINDPVIADMLIRQRRTADVAKRREIIHDIQRHLAQQQYYVQLASTTQMAVWEGALKNYGPNVSYDYGGRLVSAWLDR